MIPVALRILGNNICQKFIHNEMQSLDPVDYLKKKACFTTEDGKLGYAFPATSQQLNKLHGVCWPLLRRVSLSKSMMRIILSFLLPRFPVWC